MASRILITGIDGFTGQYVMRALQQDGHEVHGLVREQTGDPHHHQADLRDMERLIRIFAEVRPTKILHFAAISRVTAQEVDDIYTINVVGTRNLLEAVISCNLCPEAVVIASSANIYGNRTAGRISEVAPIAPINDYAISKVAAEFVAQCYFDRIPIIITRPFNYTGVGQSLDFLIPKIVDHARRRAKTIELGNLDIARDFSDIRMVTEVYRQLLRTPAAIGQTMNICSGTPYSLKEILEKVEELTGHKMQVQVNHNLVRNNEVQALWGDRSKLEALLDSFEVIPLRTTLQWMLEA